MAATFQPNIAVTYQQSISSPSFMTKFFQWCTAQNNDRLLWLGIILVAHGCVLTPLTTMTAYFADNSLYLLMLAFIAMGMALVSNLAALPTKYTLPIFALSLLIDLGIVIYSIVDASL